MSMPVPDPYFINIELYWPNGTRPNQNEIARVRAYDVYNNVSTWEGESGFNPATGGWMPVYMQNRAVFLSRGRPNLRFEVFSVQEQIVHSTQVFDQIPSGATVRITIGVGAVLVGDTPTTWTVSGHVHRQDGTPYSPGMVRAFDVTNDSEVQLGSEATLGSDGVYTITYTSTEFQSNGGSHSTPNLVVRVYDAGGVVVAERVTSDATQNYVLDIEVLGSNGTSRRVFGAVINKLGLPVSGVWVEAYHLGWTEDGIGETQLGEAVQSDGAGDYEIRYDPPFTEGDDFTCGTPAGQINLLVYAKEGTGSTAKVLKASEIIFNAAVEQEVNLLVDKEASSTDSEYTRIYDALWECLGTTPRTTLEQLDARPEYLSFVALSVGQSELIVRAFVKAWLIAYAINDETPALVLSQAMRADAMYALVRLGVGSSLEALLDVPPESFFTAIVDAIHRNLVPSNLEQDLRDDPSLLDDWRNVLAYFMTQMPAEGEEGTWQQALLNLVYPDDAARQTQVVGIYFDYQGDFTGFLEELTEKPGFSAADAENLRFVFELYDAVGRFFPTVAAVYPDKVHRGWVTVRDLGRVGELDGPGNPATDRASRGWTYYAAQAATLNGNAYPPGVPGRTNEERNKIYAARLYELFGNLGGTSRFTDEAATYASANSDDELAEVLEFFADNPDFDLEIGNIDNYLASLPADSTKPSDAVVERIKQIQRVYRLTEDFTAAQALVDAGLDSAVAIAKTKEDEFVTAHAETLGGLTAATRIHRTATQYASEVLYTAVQYNQQLNATGSGTALPNGVNVSLLISPLTCYQDNVSEPEDSSIKKLPNWITLLGDLNKCACEHCQTVLSPGAYLVDLLEFVEGVPRNQLFIRRPDLQHIEITCPNTNRVLPYIDLVNELLEGLVSPLAFTLPSSLGSTTAVVDALNALVSGVPNALATDIYAAFGTRGFVLTPFARFKRIREPATPYEENQEWIVEDESWRFTIRGPSSGQFSVTPTPQTSATNESLDVFPEHVNLGAYDILAAARFPFNLPLDLGREEVDILLRQKNAYRHEVLEAFSTADFADKLQDPAIAIAFLALSGSEAAAILADPLAGPPIWTYWGFNLTIAQAAQPVTIRRPDKPTLEITGTWEALMSRMPVFLHRSGLDYQQMLDLLDTEFVHTDAADHAAELNGLGLPRRLHVVVGDIGDAIECNYNEYQIAHLNVASLRRISFFIRLWRKLGWSMRELDRYLMAREGNVVPSSLTQVSVFKRLATILNLSPVELLAFFGDIDTRRTDRQKKSLFDEVFLDAGKDQPEYAAMQTIVAGGAIVTDPNETDLDLKTYLQGALELRRAEMDRLWWEVIERPTSGTVPVYRDLDLASLSRMYREARLARALRITISDLYDLLALIGVSPFEVPASVPWLVHACQSIGEIQRLLASGLAPADVRYTLRHEDASGRAVTLPTEQVDAIYTQVSRAAATLAEARASDPNPDATTLGASLAQVMPMNRVARAIEVIDGPPAQPEDPAQLPAWEALVAEQRTAGEEFANKYFADFLPPEGTERDAFFDFLFQYSQDNTAPVRYARVWQLLNRAVERSVVDRAIRELCAELSGLDPVRIDQLLAQGLSSTGPEATAAQEWQRLLSGGLLRRVDGTTASAVGRLVIPRDGDTTIYVVASGPGAESATITVSAPGLAAPGPAIIDTEEHETRIPIRAGALKAGTSYVIEIELPASLSLSLELEVGNADPVPAAPSDLIGPLEAAYQKLVKAAGLVQALSITESELGYLLSQLDPMGPSFLLDRLPLSPPTGDLPVTWEELGELIDLLNLNRSVALKEGTLIELWQDPEGPLDAKALAERTDWLEADITAIWELFPTSPTPPAWNSPELWYVLRACMSVVRRLDLPAAQIREQLVSETPSIAVALALRSTYRARFSRGTWRDAFKPLRDKLRQRQRDALVGYLTSEAVAGPSDSPAYHFFDANDLYAHLLVDPLMEPDTLISRLKLALNSVQLFVERVFLGLESADALAKLDELKEEWEWMRSYRVWEANRKVFLYPENWIEPELRDDKTPFFKELEGELLEDEISHEKGLRALTSYMEKLVEVSNLEVSGAYAEPVGSGPYDFILHVVARTRSRPASFYYRTFQAKQAYHGDWTPWRKIDLEIDAEVVQPGVFNGRLFLFWPQVLLKQQPQLSDSSRTTEDNINQQKAQYQNEIRLMWSEYLAAQNKWHKPRLSKGKVMDSDIQGPYGRAVGDDQPHTEHYHLRINETGNELISVGVVRSQHPTAANQGSLGLKQLGKFALRFNGHDSFDPEVLPLNVGANYPVGTLVQHNAAIESSIVIQGELAADRLKFYDSEPFLDRTPSTFRIVPTNLGLVGAAQHEPFFYETDTKSFFAFSRGVYVAAGFDREQVLRASFQTFNHPQAREIQTRLHRDGPPGIMNRLTEALPESENYYYNYSDYHANYYYNYYGNLYLGYHIAGDPLAWGTTQRKFEIEFEPGTSSVQKPYPLPTVEFGYGTPFGIYNWELFFHLPMLVADRLRQDLKFEDAMNWYHFVFDPKQELNKYEQHRRFVDDLPAGCRYWNFLPFFANQDATQSLREALGLGRELSPYERADLTALIDEWRRNPFNPHLIARRRVVAYQKNVVMKYLDNLISWADELFRRDSFESINQATQLYILADELMGDRPQIVDPLLREPRYTYRELQQMPLDDFSNAMVDLEYQVISNREHIKKINVDRLAQANAQVRNLALKTAYFRVPRNERLNHYWDTVQDRLFKIRNSMNIDGVKRQLPLFQPPIDPALLVKAAAAGIDLGSVLSQLNAPLPLYRFSIWMQKAMDLCNEVKSFGGALLSALEKKDAEALQLLRQRHEIRMLELARKVRERQIEEAQENIVALELSQTLAQERYDEYRKRERINANERQQISHTEVANTLETIQGGLHALSAAFSPIPDADVGIVGILPLGNANFKIGTAMVGIANASAAILGTVAGHFRGQANLAGIAAGHERRWEEWKLQERLAQKETGQIGQQIIAANVRLAIAEKELENHDQQVQHAEEIQDYLREKFTNRELYQWMVTQLSRSYQEVYKLAHDVAKTAERALQFELGLSCTEYIQFDYRDSLRQGLLAGEKLSNDLKRMDIAYLELNKREFEINKPISLASINPEALQTLRETGVCNFELPEILFDLDFPGQYFRRIKTVRLTIPCVTGPHTSVSAKLSLVGSAIRKDPMPGESYPYEGYDDTRFIHDLGGIQSIATSTAQGDAGLFELNFRDERYLPFEGAGAISRWRLELPTAARQFDYRTISDVVIQLSYTARDSGGLLRQKAEETIETALNGILQAVVDSDQGMVRVISMKREFPGVLQRLLASNAPVRFALTPEHFPYLLRDGNYSMTLTATGGGAADIGVHVLFKPGATLPSNAALDLAVNPEVPSADPPENTLGALDDNGISQTTLPHSAELLSDWRPETWELRQAQLTPDLIDDIALILRYTVTAPPPSP